MELLESQKSSFSIFPGLKGLIDLCVRMFSYKAINLNIQKQPFADVLQNRCSCKFRIIHRKTPVLESLFDKVAGLCLKNRIFS